MKLKRSKSWDMRYHWLRDANLRKYFHVKWAKGTENKADYFTKHFPPSHHITKRPTLFSTKTDSTISTLHSHARTFNRTLRQSRASKINIPARARINTFPLNSFIMNLQGCVSTNILLRKLSRTLTSDVGSDHQIHTAIK